MGLELMGNAAKNMKDVWLPYNVMFEKAEKAIRLLIKHGIDVQLYNFPLCSVKREYWDICSKSIYIRFSKYVIIVVERIEMVKKFFLYTLILCSVPLLIR